MGNGRRDGRGRWIGRRDGRHWRRLGNQPVHLLVASAGAVTHSTDAAHAAHAMLKGADWLICLPAVHVNPAALMPPIKVRLMLRVRGLHIPRRLSSSSGCSMAARKRGVRRRGVKLGGWAVRVGEVSCISRWQHQKRAEATNDRAALHENERKQQWSPDEHTSVASAATVVWLPLLRCTISSKATMLSRNRTRFRGARGARGAFGERNFESAHARRAAAKRDAERASV